MQDKKKGPSKKRTGWKRQGETKERKHCAWKTRTPWGRVARKGGSRKGGIE